MSGRDAKVGVVVIGRNEGKRLKACLRSLPDPNLAVYVDSGSADDSVGFARQLGVETIKLDRAIAFTAARARNSGLNRLLSRRPAPDFIQMLDGDCELAPAWLGVGVAELQGEPRLGAVFGLRRERHPDASLYNRLCAEEWDIPLGEAAFFGGDVLVRTEAVLQVGRYSADMIAGEDSEFGFRIAQAGWRIRRLDAEMTQHDAELLRFGQWWRRMLRGGYGFADLIWRHGLNANPTWWTAVARILFWGLALPVAIALALAFGSPWLGALFVLAYPVQMLRLMRREQRKGHPPREALTRAALTTICKFAEVVGMFRFWAGKVARSGPRIIEYKAPVTK